MPKSLQDLFTAGVLGILKQGRPALEEQPREGVALCRYRTKDGLKCIIGQSIPDDAYDPSFENRSAAQHPPILRALDVIPNSIPLSAIGRLQRDVHDGPALKSRATGVPFITLFQEAAEHFAIIYGLEMPDALSNPRR